MAKKNYYVVFVGEKPGIYNIWGWVSEPFTR
jgi:viroplasmin and RNaseH domain-containing protein